MAPPRLTVRQRIAKLALKVIMDENGCWIWQGTVVEKTGYGKMMVRGR
jgi:hypothetical protein